jgi:hypothetical protein
MSSEISDLLAALRRGSTTLDEVAQKFRDRSWPRRSSAVPSTYIDLAKSTQEDAPPYAIGSFDEVMTAHQEGQLTDDEYAVLSEAVAEAKRAEDEGRGAV